MPALGSIDQRRPLRGWLPIFGFAKVLAVLWALAGDPGTSIVPFVAQGPPMALPPAGELRTVSLEEFDALIAGQQGRPVLLNVWASWCAPCRVEMPLLDAAARANGDRLLVLGLASKDGAVDVSKFLREVDVSYPNVLDDSGEVRRRLGLTAFPTTYVFSADGVLTTKVSGNLSEQRLSALIADALR